MLVGPRRRCATSSTCATPWRRSCCCPRGTPGTVYNLCNGATASLGAVVAILQRLSGTPFEPIPDRSRLRPADDCRIVGDDTRLRSLDYAPRFALEDTLVATLDYWRGQPAP